MGKIKSKAIKRTAKVLIAEGVDFNENFERNKKILSDTMPSKKIRNQVAGYLARLKQQENTRKAKLIPRK
ncbi:30S ribosomal protein S17e [Candidatus Pacearchaeota archaeon]|nr:30S ribosomal protein S17e [Candidatus Pacearchaeota archaeon]